MRSAGSYDPDRGYLGVTAELARLQAQVQVSWPQEERLLRTIGLRDGLDVLEVGCGPGFFTERLLTAFPSTRITATDVRADFLRLARCRARGTAPDRCRVLATSIMDRDLDRDQFDFAIARFVLQHVGDPSVAAGEIRRLLRPGGIAAVIEVDMGLWGLVQPRIGGVDQLYARAGRLRTDLGGDRLIARRLWCTLRQAGFAEVRLDAFAYHSDELGLDAHGVARAVVVLHPQQGLVAGGERPILELFKSGPPGGAGLVAGQASGPVYLERLQLVIGYVDQAGARALQARADVKEVHPPALLGLVGPGASAAATPAPRIAWGVQAIGIPR